MARSADQRDSEAGPDRIVVNIDGLEELSAIRQSLDQIRDCIDWLLKNHRPEQWLPVQTVTNIPLDSAAPNCAPLVKTLSADKPPEKDASDQPQRQQSVDSTRINTPAKPLDDETQFCCAAPDLQWTGDPQLPGVACHNCGYIVADCGSVVMQLSPQADPDPEPKEKQRPLFTEE